MKRTRSEADADSGATEPALKKAKVEDDVNQHHYQKTSFSNLPPEMWREVASFCANLDLMSPDAGDFATFPLLTVCKSISKAVGDLPLWKFIRELKKVTISDDEWSVKNEFAEYQWNTRVVYGKTFLRMLNTVSTRLKQRSIEEAIKEQRKSIPALKDIEDFVVFDSYLDCQPNGIIGVYNEYVAYARLVSAIFTLNFSDGESVKIFFGGLTHDECYKGAICRHR